MRAMHQLAQGFSRRVEPLLGEQHGIDLRLYLIIKHIEAGSVHPGEISKLTRLPNSVITRHLDQIVAKGLLERSLDPDDSRKIKLTLTKEGQRIAREAHRTICNIVGARLEQLPTAKREAFLAGLAALVTDDANQPC